MKRHYLLLAICILVVVGNTGCQDLNTLVNEVKKQIFARLGKVRRPFTPRDGITTRSCSLYQTANPNSEVVDKLPAETPVHLVDKVGEWYRVRTRDGREGYLDRKMVAGEKVILRTQALKRSIEGMPVQAEGVIKNKANFRLEPGRTPPLDVLSAGKKFEMYERVVTLRRAHPVSSRGPTKAGADESISSDQANRPTAADATDESVKKDVWYKLKLDDGRVGYVYTHNLRFTPPQAIAKMVTFLRIVAWRTVSVTDDPDRGAQNNYLVAYAPIGKDAGCDYTHLYYMVWSKRLKRYVIPKGYSGRRRAVVRWPLRRPGILPITNYHFEGRPGFSARFLHPSKKDKLALVSYVFGRHGVEKVSEEEIDSKYSLH